jgi:hypothetical protein
MFFLNELSRNFKIMEKSIKTVRVWTILIGLCGIYIVQKSCQAILCWGQDIAEKWERSLNIEEQYWSEAMRADLGKGKGPSN